MRLKSAHKKHAQRSVIYLTFLLLLSIPIILFGLAQDDFDTRRDAFDDLELSEENPCLISFPNVNPYSLEVDKTVTVQVDAELQNQGIEQLQIFNSLGEEIYKEEFEEAPVEIATSFPFTPTSSGKATLTGILTKIQGGSVACQITSPYGIKGLEVLPNNSAPEFTSRPSESIPSQNIETGDMYEYTLTAIDGEGDRINYAYSFTPRADWLNLNVIEDGSGGKLTIKFSGKSDKPASYLANIFIHDGYSKNLRSQSWVINVSPSENDIPIVTIIDPASSLRIDKGTSFNTKWEVTDRNHVVGYELFVTNNPANEDAWIALDRDIPYDTTSYSVNTSNLDAGTYKVIVKATDNQDPPGNGKGISPEIVVSTTTETETGADDGVIISQPQVTNMSPTSDEEIANRRVSIRATIVASTGAQVDEDSIHFSVDGKDISDKMRINRISEQEYTLIFQPESDLDSGLHKAEITFSDTQDLESTKSWSFTIQEEEDILEDAYDIFGYEVSKNIVHIIGIGVLTVILALVTPFIIFSIWKDDKEDSEKSSKLPPSVPSDNTKYIQEEENTGIQEKIEEHTEEEEHEDAWDKYSAPKPVVTEEKKEKDLKDLRELDKEPDEIEKSKQEDKSEPKTQAQVIPDEPVQKPQEEEGEIERQAPSPVQQETQPQVVPENTQPPVETQQQAEVKGQKQAPQEKQPQQQETPPQTPEGEPNIPEPEIPEIKELENLSKQLQQIRDEENKEEQPPENTQ
jgi:uncharacterized protein YaiI (UPF0178 family)